MDPGEISVSKLNQRNKYYVVLLTSHTYGDDNNDITNQNAVIPRIPGVLDSIQLQQVAGITEKS